MWLLYDVYVHDRGEINIKTEYQRGSGEWAQKNDTRRMRGARKFMSSVWTFEKLAC